MRLTSITIENFKNIGERAVTIPIRPITLLFGKNSSGKSTVLQALRYLEQMSNQAGKKIIEQNSIQMSGGYTIDLSNFPSLIHRHEKDRKIRIKEVYAKKNDSGTKNYSWMEVATGWKEGRTHVESTLWGWNINDEEMCLSLSGTTPNDSVIGLNGKELIRREAFLEDFPFEIYVPANPTKDFENFMKARFSESPKNKNLDASNSSVGVHPARSMGMAIGIGGTVVGTGFFIGGAIIGAAIGVLTARKRLKRLKRLKRRIQESKKLDAIRHLGLFRGRAIIDVLRRKKRQKRHIQIQESEKLDAIRHLGPFREVPQFQTPESSWEKGLGAWDALARDPKLVKQTNHYLKEVLQLGYTIKREESDQNFQLHDENNKIDVGLSDVGVGIAQVIPVVVGALDGSSNTFAVEQPELHVHPAVQVALGDLFIDAIKNSNRTMLIETHSEHLLLRLLRRVRETTQRRHRGTESEQPCYELTPDDLSVIYVRSTPAGVKFTPINVTEDGDFDAPWPEGFFEERDSEWY